MPVGVTLMQSSHLKNEFQAEPRAKTNNDARRKKSRNGFGIFPLDESSGSSNNSSRKSSVNHSGRSSNSSNNSIDTKTRSKFQRQRLQNVLLGPVEPRHRSDSTLDTHRRTLPDVDEVAAVGDPIFYYIKTSHECPCSFHDQVRKKNEERSRKSSFYISSNSSSVSSLDYETPEALIEDYGRSRQPDFLVTTETALIHHSENSPKPNKNVRKISPKIEKPSSAFLKNGTLPSPIIEGQISRTPLSEDTNSTNADVQNERKISESNKYFENGLSGSRYSSTRDEFETNKELDVRVRKISAVLERPNLPRSLNASSPFSSKSLSPVSNVSSRPESRRITRVESDDESLTDAESLALSGKKRLYRIALPSEEEIRQRTSDLVEHGTTFSHEDGSDHKRKNFRSSDGHEMVSDLLKIEIDDGEDCPLESLKDLFETKIGENDYVASGYVTTIDINVPQRGAIRKPQASSRFDPTGNWTLKRMDNFGQETANSFDDASSSFGSISEVDEESYISVLPSSSPYETASAPPARRSSMSTVPCQTHLPKQQNWTNSPSQVHNNEINHDEMRVWQERFQPNLEKCHQDNQLPLCIQNIILQHVQNAETFPHHLDELMMKKKMSKMYFVPHDPSNPAAFTEAFPGLKRSSGKNCCGSKPVQKIVGFFIFLMTVGLVVTVVCVYYFTDTIRPMM